MARSIELVAEGAVAVGRAGARGRGAAEVLERYAVVVLVLLAAAGFALRAGGLGRVGFAEDEITKLDAVASYKRGDITANAEHPMLMKSLMFVSVEAARAWNRAAPAALRVSDEASLRMPNVLFGALTVVPLYLLAACFFGRRTALLAAAFWAFGVNAITYNRIAKEDTLLVFFMLLATYFYIGAKMTSGFDAGRKRLLYILSGAAFGLMLASKYFPHYFGLVMLYQHLVTLRRREPGEPRGTTPRVFFVVILAVFILANPAVLLPETWAYLRAYSSEGLLTHHGYLMGERLYDNVMSKTPFGATPFYFYLLFLAVKVPLVTLAALVVGLFVLARRRREPGPLFLLLMFTLWLVPFSLAGAKWLRYALSLMPLVYMIGAVGVAWLVRRVARALKGRDGEGFPHASTVVGALAVVVFVCAPAFAAVRAMPHYALYTNALGKGSAGHFFPHDEFYDDGLREAVRYVAETAPTGATIAHETPGVVRHYLEKFGRTDLQSRVISDPQFNPLDAAHGGPPVYAVVQRGRTYFENRDELTALRRAARKEHEVLVRDAVAAEVYAVAGPPR